MINTNKKVSIVIPVYNVEKHIERCLDSVLAQTYKNISVIIIDDGSTDSSGAICDSYAEKEERIRVFHTENRGLCNARNAGLDKIKGDYVIFVDSDDYLAPDTIEFLLDRLHKYDADISAGGYDCVDEEGNSTPREKTSFDDGAITTDEYWRLFYTDVRTYYVVVWAKLYKGSLWKSVRFPTKRGLYHEDEFVTHQILDQCETIALSNKTIYHYLQRQGSIMGTVYSEKNLDAAEGILLRCEYFIDKGNYPLAAKTLMVAMYSILKGYGYLGKIDRIKELRKTFRRLYGRLLLKKCNRKTKLKCGIFCVSIKLFAKIKNGRS